METRRAPRVKITAKVICKVDQKAQQKFCPAKGDSFEVEVVDISFKGIGVFSEYFLPKGLRIEVEIEGKPFGLAEPMNLAGEVRHSDYTKDFKYRCGILFVDMPAKYEKKIADFIAAYEPRKEPRYKLSD